MIFYHMIIDVLKDLLVDIVKDSYVMMCTISFVFRFMDIQSRLNHDRIYDPVSSVYTMNTEDTHQHRISRHVLV